jgi:hypothetical protein
MKDEGGDEGWRLEAGRWMTPEIKVARLRLEAGGFL